MNLSNIVHTGHQINRKSPQHKQYTCSPQVRRLNGHEQDMAVATAGSPQFTQSPLPSPPTDTLPSISSLIKMNIAHAGHGSDGQPTVSSLASPCFDPFVLNDFFQSPSASSSHSSIAGPPYAGNGAFNHHEMHPQRQAPPPSSHPNMMAPQPPQSPYQNSSFAELPSSNTPYHYSPTTGPVPPTMYYQRALPSGFSPSTPPGSVKIPNSTKAESSSSDTNEQGQWQNQHQHHHYIAHSSSTQFPNQNADRYVCQICQKAFSRPSSLRIHSHSHTGEKPFQCPHKGCGKAFSVRSNMKRHERGCHGGGNE